MHRDLFEPRATYRTESVGWWHVLLRDGVPVAQGSLDTLRLNPGYAAELSQARRCSSVQ